MEDRWRGRVGGGQSSGDRSQVRCGQMYEMMTADCRIYFVSEHWVLPGAREWLGNFARRLAAQSSEAVATVANADAATHILFLDGGSQRTRFWEANRLAGHPLLRAYPDRCYVWNTEDRPATYLPGLYVSMPKGLFDPQVHRAFRYMELNTERLPVHGESKRDIFYNFLGAPTAPVRRAILSAHHPSDAVVQEKLNFNHQRHAAKEDVGPYAEILARSRFTLCPPGSGTSSYRIFEAMRAGSIPVVISDRLVLPDGPDWSRCSVRIAENDAGRAPDILAGVSDPEGMGQASRKAYGDFFDSTNMLTHIARELTALGAANQKAARRCFNRERLVRGWEKIGGN
jgi:hypothetical protein